MCRGGILLDFDYEKLGEDGGCGRYVRIQGRCRFYRFRRQNSPRKTKKRRMQPIFMI